MNARLGFAHRSARGLLLGITWLLAALPVAAQFLNPLSISLGVSASADNGSPGVARNSSGTGPIADSASETFGLNTADSSASVDAAGLHATSAVHADSTNNGDTAAAVSFAGLANPFILVPQAGFIGTTALLRIPYSFAGSLNIFPSLQACSSCFGAVQASVGVDGMADQFSFLGASSQGTINNPTFFLGGVARSGVLEGRVPVNTELYLRGSLVTQVHCQSNIALSCGTEALFGGTLTYNGFSPDAVDFVWGLTPTAAVAAVPEPTTWLLFGVGVLGLVGRCATGRRRR